VGRRSRLCRRRKLSKQQNGGIEPKTSISSLFSSPHISVLPDKPKHIRNSQHSIGHRSQTHGSGLLLLDWPLHFQAGNKMLARLVVLSAAVFAVTSPARAEVVISTKPTQNMNCNAGVCMPTAKNAVLNVGDLTDMLAAGDLTVRTGNGDGTAAAITITDGFSWTTRSA
jgi:hypothetical protein